MLEHKVVNVSRLFTGTLTGWVDFLSDVHGCGEYAGGG